jgi:hypothetical protein
MFKKKVTLSQDKYKEPDWNVLYNFGLPVNVPNVKKNNYNYNIILKNLILAADFLIKNKHDINYIRYYDGYKSLLLALKTHYPEKLKKIEDRYSVNFSKLYDLKKIEGKHIKLRNICLYSLSQYFNQK